jgi:hypothetical protein
MLILLKSGLITAGMTRNSRKAFCVQTAFMPLFSAMTLEAFIAA